MGARAFFLLFATLFVVSHQAPVKFTNPGQQCAEELKITIDTVASFSSNGKISEDDELAEKYFGCRLAEYVNDTNEFVPKDSYVDYVAGVFTRQLRGDTDLAKRLAGEFVTQCKDHKGETKGKTAIAVTNCLMTKVEEYKKNLHQ